MPINELRSISTFVKAAELGSLRRAAAEQGISPQAASQALAQLEQHLGLRLFHRTTRQLMLTEEGQRFLESARPALAELQRALQLARSATGDFAGPLRIAAPQSSILPVLAPVLNEYTALHPELRPEVHLDDHIGNWVEERVDVGFRIGRSAEEGVIARRLFTLQMIVCAAPAYLAQHGAPKTPQALVAHRCSVFRPRSSGKLLPWYFKRDGQIDLHHMTPAFVTNSEALELEAVRAGQVIGLLTSVTAAALIRSGELVPLFAEQVADHLSLFLYYGHRSEQPARVRGFIDLALARLVGNPAFELTADELATAEAQGRRAAHS